MRDMLRGKIAGPEFTALVQDVGDPKIFYAGGSWSKDMGGSPVNKSTNSGKKWDPAGTGITGNVTLMRSVAPGVVYTPLHRETPKDVMESLSPMGRPSTVKDITDAVMYLTDAATVTGDILYVDGGSHFGRW